jgi:hypothetical protein
MCVKANILRGHFIFNFKKNMNFTDISTISIIVSIIALLYAVGLIIHVLSKDKGNQKMQSIAKSIQEGANAYLHRQSLTVLFFAILVFLVLAYLFRNAFKQTTLFKKVVAILKNFKEGFISIRSIKRKGWFWFHSVFIWFCYYLMLYSIFFAFDFTRDLNPIAGLTTFVFASFGMVAPVQGGIGAWHFMAIEGLRLYGVAFENGVIFAFVAHTSMTVMIIAVGLISMLILPFINRRDDVEVNKTVP